MAVSGRKDGQEGNRLFARSADTAPNRDPVMVFVMSLLLPPAMTNDRILRANWAPANDDLCDSPSPIGFHFALRRGNWDKDDRANGVCYEQSDRTVVCAGGNISKFLSSPVFPARARQ